MTPDASVAAFQDFVGYDDPLLADLRSGTWLDQQDFPTLRYHVPGLIPEGSTLLVGPPKIGKSWFVLSVALGIANGGHVLGRLQVDPRPVLYLALEDGHRRLQNRCRKLLEGAQIPRAFEYLTVIEPGRVVATIAAWLAAHSSHEPLVILDTLGKVMPPALLGESSYQRDYRIGSELKRLADEVPGMALVVNHHDRKASAEDFVDAVSGTHGLAGAADTVVVLNRSRHESAAVLKVTGRDVAEGEYALTFGGALWQLGGGSLVEAAERAAEQRSMKGLSDRSADVIAYVNRHPQGVSPKQVAEALELDNHVAGTYLGRAVEAQRLIRPTRGLYAPVLKPLKVEMDEGADG